MDATRRQTAVGGGAGGGALAGYEYQIDVSIWLALDLVLASKLAQQIVLEPDSQEDLEADLEEHEPERVIGAVSMEGYRLVVQVKLRGGDAWSVAGIKALLRHGGDTRVSAAKRLAALDTRYLLVTSAALNGGVKGLAVRRAAVWPAATAMPASIRKALPPGAPGRVAVIGNQDEERLATDIHRLLTAGFRVPHARWTQCLRSLRDEARLRIRGAGAGRWHRSELEQIIRAHEGYIASSPELDHYVHPTQWSSLTSAMDQRHAALIVGQSGTGKTLATWRLHEELSEKIPGLARVPITHGPQQLLNDRTPPPVLYDIEDPWGRFDFDERSRPWNDQLARCFASATHDRMIIATSRMDVARSSGALNSVEQWVVGLEAEHYGQPERRRLYRTRIGALPRDLQAIATRAEKTVLSQLGTPLEIQKFFDALPTIDRKAISSEHRFIAGAIEHAHQESIERTVIEQIEQRKDLRAATVLWALLKANGKISLRGIRDIEDGLADRDPHLADGVEPLIQFFVAARNLRQNEETVTLYHPRVESGIEQALLRHAAVVRRTLRQLVDVLTSADGQGALWGAGAAARIIAGTERLPSLRPSPSPAAQRAIDDWITDQSSRVSKDLEAQLRLAAAAGSSGCNSAELARYLLHRPDDSLMGFMRWERPDRDDEWYARMRSDPATRQLLDGFVRFVLPGIRTHYPKSFAETLKQLAPGLTEAFLAAAAQIVSYGVVDTDDAIAWGALDDVDGFESIIDSAVEVMTPSEAERRQAEQQHLSIINGEYSEDYAEYLSNDDAGYTAGEFLTAYVERLRRSYDWRRIAGHRHCSRLLFYWVRDICNEGVGVALDSCEVEAAFNAVQGGEHEALLWMALQRRWQPANFDRLVDRVRAGNSDPSVRHAALACLIEHAPQALPDIVSELAAARHHARMAGVAIDLSELCDQRRDDRNIGFHAIEAAVTALPRPMDQLARAAIAISKDENPSLSPEVKDFIVDIVDGDIGLRRLRVLLDRHVGLPVDDDIRWLLVHGQDDDAAMAVAAAARRNMSPDVEGALVHRFARVSAIALTAVAGPMVAPLPESILAMAGAKGRFVRAALVKILDAKPHPDHLPALLQLAQDTWSTASTRYGEDGHFPIARAAVDAIGKLGQITSDIGEQLLRISIDTSDPALRYALFEQIVRQADDALRERILELATTPGRIAVQRAAALALLHGAELPSRGLASRITAELLTTRAASVAAPLALLLTLLAEPPRVVQVAQGLAAHRDRRALVLLMIWLMNSRAPAIATQIAALLPEGHVAVAQALGMEQDQLTDKELSDLGDPLTVAEVLTYIGKERDQPGG